MSFVHCHQCGWGQDDFWSWGYNPLRCLWRRVKDYAWPRMCKFDPPPHSYGTMHSWRVLWHECVRILRRIPAQQWWTYRSYLTSKRACPQCGTSKLCID